MYNGEFVKQIVEKHNKTRDSWMNQEIALNCSECGWYRIRKCLLRVSSRDRANERNVWKWTTNETPNVHEGRLLRQFLNGVRVSCRRDVFGSSFCIFNPFDILFDGMNSNRKKLYSRVSKWNGSKTRKKE